PRPQPYLERPLLVALQPQRAGRLRALVEEEQGARPITAHAEDPELRRLQRLVVPVGVRIRHQPAGQGPWQRLAVGPEHLPRRRPAWVGNDLAAYFPGLLRLTDLHQRVVANGETERRRVADVSEGVALLVALGADAGPPAVAVSARRDEPAPRHADEAEPAVAVTLGAVVQAGPREVLQVRVVQEDEILDHRPHRLAADLVDDAALDPDAAP